MRLIIDACQVLKIKSRVYLRGADTGMAEQFLHGAQIPARLQHMTGKRVSQHVGVDGGGDTGQKTTLPEPESRVLGRQPTALAVHKNRNGRRLTAHCPSGSNDQPVTL